MTALTSARMAELIGVALEEDGLTQAEFARRTGLSPKHVNQVLNGKSFPPTSTLDFMAFVLGRRFALTLERI